MDSNEYQRLTGRTESIPDGTQGPYIPLPDYPGYVGIPIRLLRIVHHILGMAGEAGELCDQLKRHMFYFKPLDEANIVEECGDSDWYNARLLDTIQVRMADAHKININKLQVRYPEKFSTEAATNRDLAAERAVLEDTGPTVQAQKRDLCACGGIPLDNGSGLCDACYEEHMVKMHRTRPLPTHYTP